MSFKKRIYVSLICCILVLYFFPVSLYCNEVDYSDSYDFNSTEVSVEASPFPTLNSRSAIVIEKSTGTILFGKNENDQRKMASTTKIMTAIVVLEKVNDLSEIVTISKKSAGIGGSRLGLSTNSQVSVNDLLYGLLLCSGNDAAIALAEFVGENVAGFADLMNQKALELGLLKTHFVTPHGLDDDNHYTTAYELALLTKYALKNETFSQIVRTHTYTVSISGSPKTIHNTNELLGNLNGVYGVKTGFTNGANRCLVSSCKRGDLDIICVVLGADTKKFRTQDSIKLIEYAFSNFEMVDIDSLIQKSFSEWQSKFSNNFTVNKGFCNDVETYLESIPYSKYPVNKATFKDIQVNINCSYYFEAPLLKDFKLGTLSCFVKDVEICNLDICVSKPILKKDIFSYFNGFFSNYVCYLESIFSF